MKHFLIIIYTLFCFVTIIPVSAGFTKPGQGKEAVSPMTIAFKTGDRQKGIPALVSNASAKTGQMPIPLKTPARIKVVKIIRSASLVVQLTILLLVFMSIISWAVILSKWHLFRSNAVGNAPFEDVFFKASSLDEIFDMSKSYPNSSLAAVFRSGYSELKKIVNSKQVTGSGNLLSGMDNLQRALNKAVGNEISYMERRLSLLATTGSVSPFIGLFGTVFGIMGSFQQIGAMGAANLAVVAPGISEALIATGFGLFAAIPAAVFYNQFINEIKKAELQFNNFVTDFLNISKRNFFK